MSKLVMCETYEKLGKSKQVIDIRFTNTGTPLVVEGAHLLKPMDEK